MFFLSYPLVSIVIINWENWADTEACLISLEQNNYKNYSVIIVDNFSQDGSFEKIQEYTLKKKRFKLIRTEYNLGFAGGVNVGIRDALGKGADYVLLLNNDTIVETDFLTNLVNTAEADSDTGMVSGKILYSHDKKVWYMGGKIAWLRGGGYHPGKGKANKESLRTAPFEVNFISGCMMLIKKEVFEKIGLFDESYFLYNEDADYCLRASRAAIRMMVNPVSVIYHKESSTDGGWKPYHIYYLIRNKLIYMKRLAPNIIILSTFYLIVAVVGIALSSGWFLQRRFDLIRAYKEAIADFVRGVEGKRPETRLVD